MAFNSGYWKTNDNTNMEIDDVADYIKNNIADL